MHKRFEQPSLPPLPSAAWCPLHSTVITIFVVVTSSMVGCGGGDSAGQDTRLAEEPTRQLQDERLHHQRGDARHDGELVGAEGITTERSSAGPAPPWRSPSSHPRNTHAEQDCGCLPLFSPTHVLLDGLHPRFGEATKLDAYAVHDGFADIVALFQRFSHPEILEHQIARTGGDLQRQNLLGQLAQQLGRAIGRRGALRDAIGGVNRDAGRWEPRYPSSFSGASSIGEDVRSWTGCQNTIASATGFTPRRNPVARSV